jgi:hypothetical protein
MGLGQLGVGFQRLLKCGDRFLIFIFAVQLLPLLEQGPGASWIPRQIVGHPG